MIRSSFWKKGLICFTVPEGSWEITSLSTNWRKRNKTGNTVRLWTLRASTPWCISSTHVMSPPQTVPLMRDQVFQYLSPWVECHIQTTTQGSHMPHNHIIPFLSSFDASHLFLLMVTEVLNCLLGLDFLVNSLLGSSQSVSVAVTIESKHINSFRKVFDRISSIERPLLKILVICHTLSPLIYAIFQQLNVYQTLFLVLGVQQHKRHKKVFLHVCKSTLFSSLFSYKVVSPWC